MRICWQCSKRLLSTLSFLLLKRGSSATMEVQQMLTRRMMDLRSELRNLEQKETFLDLQKFWIEESIRNATEDCSKYPFSKSAESRSWCLFEVFCYVEWEQKVFKHFIMHYFHLGLNSNILWPMWIMKISATASVVMSPYTIPKPKLTGRSALLSGWLMLILNSSRQDHLSSASTHWN